MVSGAENLVLECERGPRNFVLLAFRVPQAAGVPAGSSMRGVSLRTMPPGLRLAWASLPTGGTSCDQTRCLVEWSSPFPVMGVSRYTVGTCGRPGPGRHWC